jgi:integrase
MLAARLKNSSSEFVFPGREGKPMLVTSLDHQHAKVRELLKMPEDFVVHSLRHTMLTRLGLLGVDAFTIMKIAGHSSITISQRYVHPSPESVERAFEKLEVSNQPGRRKGPGIELGIAVKNDIRQNRRKAVR